MITLDTVVPARSPMLFDVMIGERFYKTVSLKLTVGVEYKIEELKSFTRMKLASLANRDFNLEPTMSPVYRA